jgi:SAM-dependent methyltransferase
MFKNIFSKKPKVMTETLEEEILTEVDSEQTSPVVDDALLDFPLMEGSVNEEVESESIEEVEDVTSEEFREWEMLNAPEMVGWLSTQEQEVLFNALLMFYQPEQSVLDAGCGRADLFGLIGPVVSLYKGIDYNENILNIARRKYPGVNVEAIDLLDFNEPDTYDWVFASGMFNTRMDNAIEYSQQCVDKMFETAKVGVAFNLLTGIPEDLAEEDKEQVIVWDSGAWLNYLVSKYTKVICRTDYMQGDTTFFIFK